MVVPSTRPSTPPTRPAPSPDSSTWVCRLSWSRAGSRASSRSASCGAYAANVGARGAKHAPTATGGAPESFRCSRSQTPCETPYRGTSRLPGFDSWHRRRGWARWGPTLGGRWPKGLRLRTKSCACYKPRAELPCLAPRVEPGCLSARPRAPGVDTSVSACAAAGEPSSARGGSARGACDRQPGEFTPIRTRPPSE